MYMPSGWWFQPTPLVTGDGFFGKAWKCLLLTLPNIPITCSLTNQWLSLPCWAVKIPKNVQPS